MNSLNFVTIDKLKSQANIDDTFAMCDIRTPQEFAREHIPASFNVPVDQLASYDFSRVKNKTIVFLCRSGVRTRNAQSLISERDLPQVVCLEGGLEKWIAAGLPTVKNTKVPIDIMRQVQIIAGSLILAGVVGGYFASPFLLLVPLFVGTGLLMAGLTGFCGMAKLLAKLPYNRPDRLS